MRWNHSETKSWGMFLLALWMIATGVQPFLHVTFVNVGLFSALLALASGILLLLGR